MSHPWEKDAWFLHNVEQFLNGKETFRGAMIQAFIAGMQWQTAHATANTKPAQPDGGKR
jgi:hypothetical protein